MTDAYRLHEPLDAGAARWGPAAEVLARAGELGARLPAALLVELGEGHGNGEELLHRAEALRREEGPLRLLPAGAEPGALPEPVEPAELEGRLEALAARGERAALLLAQPPLRAQGRARLGEVGGVEIELEGSDARWRAYRRADGGFELRALGPPDALPRERLLELAELALYFRERAGGGLELRWTLDRGGWFRFHAARPWEAPGGGLALPGELPEPRPEDRPLVVWTRLDLPELARDTPGCGLGVLGWSLWRRFVLPGWVRLLLAVSPHEAERLRPIDRVRGRLYWNLDALLLLPGGARLLRRRLERLCPGAGERLVALLREGALHPRRLLGGRLRLLPALLLAGFANLGRLVLLSTAWGLERPLERFRAELRALGRGLALLSGEELLRFVERALHPARFPHARYVLASGLGRLSWRRLWRLLDGSDEARQLLGRGAGAPLLARRLVELEDLARAARPLAGLLGRHASWPALREALDASPEGRAWRSAFEAFLARHGHRGRGELDPSAPRWAEQPERLLAVLRHWLRHPPPPVGRRLLERARRRERALRRALAGRGPLHRLRVRLLDLLLRRFLGSWERSRDALALAFHGVRRAVLELGRRLAESGALERPGDALLLELGELADRVRSQGPWGAGHLAARAEAEARARSLPAPAFLRSDGVPFLEAEEGGRCRRPIWGCGGRAEGVLRRLGRDGPPAELRPGDLLAVEDLDPDAALLLPWAGALLVEAEGPFTAAAMAARELGIPVVAGLRLDDFPEGARLRVEGAAARVELLED